MIDLSNRETDVIEPPFGAHSRRLFFNYKCLGPTFQVTNGEMPDAAVYEYELMGKTTTQGPSDIQVVHARAEIAAHGPEDFAQYAAIHLELAGRAAYLAEAGGCNEWRKCPEQVFISAATGRAFTIAPWFINHARPYQDHEYQEVMPGRPIQVEMVVSDYKFIHRK